MTDAPISERLARAFEGRYELLRELGKGGMATVYLANDLKHDRQVAIKVLKPELAAVIGGERFVAEIKTTAGLQHPHILPLFDSGEIDGFLFYVMPYVVGETLRQRLDRERQLGVEDALRITRDVADALDYAHRQGVIHRDIKPENILLHDGRPVVADFGIAVAISAAGGGRMTETGLSLGTPHYMSPEQATADRDLTVRSDVYSLSCVLYEMLAGDPPHTGPSAQAILVRILTETPRPVIDTRTSVPPHVAAVIAKGLEKLPADRFDSAAEFREALDRTDFRYAPVQRATGVASHQPMASPRGSGGEPAHRPAGRLVPILATATVLLAVLALFGWLRPSGPVAEPATYTLDLTGWELPAFARVEISPDGRTFATVATPADSSGERQLIVRRADELHFRPLVTSGDPEFPVFSPDGGRIAYVDGDADAIRVIPVDGGTPTTRFQEDGLNMSELAWGDDGYMYFWASGQVRRIPEAGGASEELRGGAGWAYEPTPLPGGRAILLTDSRTSPSSLAVYELGTDSVRTLIREATRAQFVESGHLVYAHPDGGLMAVAFDPERLEVTGVPTPVRDGVSVDGELTFYALSRNGTLVYIEGRSGGLTGETLLVEKNLMTGEEVEVRLEPRPIRGVTYAPDGDRIALAAAEPNGDQSDAQLQTYDLRLGSSPRTWPFESRALSPAWSPSGDRVAYEAYDGTVAWLMIQDVTSEAPPTRVATEGGPEIFRYEPEWAGDSVLVYVRGNDSGLAHLWTVGASGTPGPREYLASERRLAQPDVSHDGTRIAYVVFGEFDDPEIMVRTFPEPGVPVRVSVGGGVAPKWHPDGSSVLYLRRDGPTDAASVHQAFVTHDPLFTVDSTRNVFEVGNIRDWDIRPDGDRIIFTRPPDSSNPDDDEPETPERYVVVLNWFTELAERLGR